MEEVEGLDTILVPISGGGMASGQGTGNRAVSAQRLVLYGIL